MKPKINIEWLVTEKCNFKCSYCGLYNNKKKPETDLSILSTFIKSIHRKQLVYDFDFFVFGGEPFLHPNIDFIIGEMNYREIKYTIQSNCSSFSICKIKELENKIKSINFSIHLREFQNKENIFNNIQQAIDLKVNIKNIEVMYIDSNDENLYYELVNIFPNLNIILCPVSDFLVSGFSQSLKNYNLLMNHKKDIQFENVRVPHPETKIETPRSIIWEEFIDQKISPKNKLCILKDKFMMYDSQLRIYNCCFHMNMVDNICKFDTCFLS